MELWSYCRQLTVQWPLSQAPPPCWTQEIQPAELTDFAACIWRFLCSMSLKKKQLEKVETRKSNVKFLISMCGFSDFESEATDGCGGCWIIIPWNRKTVVESTRCCPLCDNKQHWFSSHRLIYVGPNVCYLDIPWASVCLQRWADMKLLRRAELSCSVTNCIFDFVS